MAKKDKRCIVPGCLNYNHAQSFVGDLCGPCHSFLMNPSSSKYSQLYRNFVAFANAEYGLKELGIHLKKIIAVAGEK